MRSRARSASEGPAPRWQTPRPAEVAPRETRPAEPLEGVILDAESGAPLPGARVAIAPDGRRVAPPRAQHALSAGDGRFRLASQGGPAIVMVSLDGYLPELSRVEPGAGELTLVLARGGALRGVLRDGPGLSVAGVRVVAVSREAMDVAEAITAGDGSFAMTSLRPGPYEVSVAPEHGHPARSATIEVRAGHEAVAVLRAPGGSPRAPA